MSDQQFRGMPAAETIAAQAIGRMVADGYSSSMMKLPRPTLNEFARRILTPGSTTREAIEWLEGTPSGGVPETNIYRWVQRFREIYKLLWGEYANKLLVNALASDPSFRGEDLQRLIKHRTQLLIAQQVMTSNPEDLDNGRLSNVLAMITAADKGELDRAKLELAREQAEARIAKLQSDIDARERKIEQTVNALQRRIEELSKRVRAGKAIPQSVFDELRSELLGLSDERPQEAMSDEAGGDA